MENNATIQIHIMKNNEVFQSVAVAVDVVASAVHIMGRSIMHRMEKGKIKNKN